MHLGVKAHWRDVDVMADVARSFGARTLEVHLTARDVYADRERVLGAFTPHADAFRLVVHQPEWTVDETGERIFTDASSADWRIQGRAVDALARAAGVARELGAAGLVVHPGAVDLPGRSEAGSVHNVREVLQTVRIHEPGVPLWLENMPWFYGWEGPGSGLVGLARLGRTPDEYAPVDDVVDGYCLDFCHAFLAAPAGEAGGGWAAVDAFLDAWAGRIRHVHVAGATRYPREASNPRAGEGVPLADGDMDALAYARRLARVPAGVAVVPEIEEGFRDDARGFRDALAWLRHLDADA